MEVLNLGDFAFRRRKKRNMSSAAGETIGLAGTWGTKYAKRTGEPVDFTTTYNHMMNVEQLESEMRKDMGSSYSRFRKRSAQRTPVIVYTKSKKEQAMEDARILKMGEYTCPPPDRSLSRAPSRTMVRRLHSMDAPPAVGRPGMPVPGLKERSALSATGERFNMDGDPQRDSFINRSWMVRDDPALLYMRDGLPKAYMPNDVSLSVGMNDSNKVIPGWHHGRKYDFTGDPLSKSGSKKAGIFMDEFDKNGQRILGDPTVG